MEKNLWNLALILAATKAGGLASRKVKMPEVLGALLAGILIGPVGFGLVPYDDGVKLLADLGVIFLMFLAGLETDLERFKKAGKSAFAIALLGILFPLVLGTWSAFLFSGNRAENLFIGVILTATSVSITAETLAEMGKLSTLAGTNILGAAVIDDILGLILVSVMLSMRGGSGESLPGRLAGIALFCLLGVAAIYFFPKIVRAFESRSGRNLRPSRTFFTFSLALVLLAAFAAERSGIAAITGAYLCGLLFSQVPGKEYLQRSVGTVSSGFLSPVFFASVGLEVSRTGFSRKEIVITLVMFLIAVLGKMIGCGLGARLFRISRPESLQIGAGMVSRGEVALITANIGLQANLISQEIFVPTLFVVLLTTVITPILLKLSFSRRPRANRAE